MKLKVYHTVSTDPWRNLAVEEHLLHEVKPDDAVLYLWQNARTVVIGRNQDAQLECRTSLLESEGGRLARRLSGGGAVFHDMGNLNFTFLTDHEHYSVERQAGVIRAAVARFGIDAVLSGRNDLTANGRKFSGNAFCAIKTARFHHGTILVDADLELMTRYLSPGQEKLSSKGIASVEARVVNLRSLSDSMTIGALGEALVSAFAEEYGGEPEMLSADDLHSGELDALRQRYASREWLSRNFLIGDVQIRRRLSFGGFDIRLGTDGGRIAAVSVCSDANDPELPRAVERALTGVELTVDSVLAAIHALRETDAGEKEELAGALREGLMESGFH